MTTPILLEKWGTFPTKPFTALAAEAWSIFFKDAPPDCDLAHWFVEPDSATIKISPRCTSINEEDPSWEPLFNVVMLVNGIIPAFEQSPEREYGRLRIEFRDWATLGILEALEKERILRQFNAFLSNRREFAVVTSPTDEGLSNDELVLVWTSHKDFDLSVIRKRQSASQKPRKLTKNAKMSKPRVAGKKKGG